MKITFLGTGTSQGVPPIISDADVAKSLDFRDKRLRTALHVEINGKSIVIDTGPDFRQQMMQNKIDKIDAILFTHEHRDHIAGFDDVRTYFFNQNKPMPVFGERSCLEYLQKQFDYIFNPDQDYPGVLKADSNFIDKEPFEFDGIEITPIALMHKDMHVRGYRFGDFTYITDANYISEEEKKKVAGSKVIVINGLQWEPHYSHFTINEVLELLNEWNPERAYLTHISSKMGFHIDIDEQLPENVSPAYDGLKLLL